MTIPHSSRPTSVTYGQVRIHFIIVMIRWTGLAPWEFEFPFPGSLTSTFLDDPAQLASHVGHLSRGVELITCG